MAGEKKKRKPVKAMLGCSVDEPLKRAIDEMAQQTGATKAEITRRALKSYVDGGQDEPLVMMHVVQMVQAMNDLKDVIPKKDYEKLQNYAGNIMKIKGGNGDGKV